MPNKTLLEYPIGVERDAPNRSQKRAIEKGIDLSRIPKHVAMIMDGNGRWAQKQGLARLKGHYEGYQALRATLKSANELGVEYLTVYAFSTENWNRPVTEVKGLMQLIEKAANEQFGGMLENNVRFRTSGRVHEIPQSAQNALARCAESTKNNTGITFTVAINYGGRAEIVDAVRSMVAKGFLPESITEETLTQHLYNPDIPDPDLMIRTAGEVRNSNFLLWESAYCEFYASPVPWPAFSLDTFLDAILNYQQRIRNFGYLRPCV